MARAKYRPDGAKRFREVPGGLNQMSIRRFEKLVDEAGLILKSRKYECVRGMNFFASIPVLREFFINHVTVLLTRN